MDPKYPEVSVKLLDGDGNDLADKEAGNAFNILAKVRRALRDSGISAAEIDAFGKEATKGDYDHLLQTVMKWVTVD